MIAKKENDAKVRIGLAAVTILSLFSGFGCSRAQTSSSCISDANGLSAASRARYLNNDLVGAARLQYQAASGLGRCLDEHPRERTISSEQRLGEMEMISGELEHDTGDSQMARMSLVRAKNVFSRLRRGIAPRGTVFDVILLEAHQVDGDLAKL